MKPNSDIISHLNLYKRWCAYSRNYKLSNAIPFMYIIISFGQVEKDHANISTVIPVNNSCLYINVMLPRETGSKECQQNLHHMAIAGEDGDVKDETIKSWNERVREITRGSKPEDVWNMEETGSFWRGLSETSLNEKGRRCNGGKQAKQRNTWAFSVNAAGEKEDPIVKGKYTKPRCFKNLKDIKRPYRCWYFFNTKAWMTTELMNEVLSRLNATLIRKKRSILLFLDIAPCHPSALAERFSNISIKFLPKNTTSKTQPLDAGIIANWKVKYKKRLLRYVCSKVDESISASDIVKSINISMAIGDDKLGTKCLLKQSGNAFRKQSSTRKKS